MLFELFSALLLLPSTPLSLSTIGASPISGEKLRFDFGVGILLSILTETDFFEDFFEATLDFLE